MTTEKASKIDTGLPGPFLRGWLAPRFWPTWFGLGLLWLLAHGPAALRRGLAALIGALTWRYNPKRRAIVLLNLAWCFPERSVQQREAMARRYFRYAARSLLDYGLIWWGSDRALARAVRLEGGEHIQTALAAGRPVIVFTPHSVALDFGAAAMTRVFPAVGMFKSARNPLLDWYIARGRTRFRGIVTPREKGVRPLVRGMRQGLVQYYLPDEDFGADKSLFVPFFGVPTATITGLSRMAAMVGAVAVPLYTWFDDREGCYVARLFPALDNFPSGDDVADAVQMNAAMEHMIRLAPEQYMWSLRMFQTRPDGAPPPYAMKGKPGSGQPS